MTSSVVWRNVGQTNWWRLKHAVKISPWQTRRRSPSGDQPEASEVDLAALAPVAGRSTRTVTVRLPAPQRSTAKRARVRGGTTTPGG